MDKWAPRHLFALILPWCKNETAVDVADRRNDTRQSIASCLLHLVTFLYGFQRKARRCHGLDLVMTIDNSTPTAYTIQVSG